MALIMFTLVTLINKYASDHIGKIYSRFVVRRKDLLLCHLSQCDLVQTEFLSYSKALLEKEYCQTLLCTSLSVIQCYGTHLKSTLPGFLALLGLEGPTNTNHRDITSKKKKVFSSKLSILKHFLLIKYNLVIS